MTVIMSCVTYVYFLRKYIQAKGEGEGEERGTVFECKPSFVSVRKMFASKHLTRANYYLRAPNVLA